MNYYLEQMIKLDADGIDFYPIFTPIDEIPNNIIASYTKEQIENGIATPKTDYFYYKIVNGKKTYIKN